MRAVSMFLSGRVGQRDCFARDDPSPLEAQPEAWDLARTVIDHGCFFLAKLSDTDRDGLGLRDWVVMALLRRILITGEAVRLLLERGLDESASATSRTLLELERNVRLVLGDASDGCARRLLVFGALKSRRHFEKAPKSPSTREWLCQDQAFFAWFKSRSRSFRDFIGSDEFRGVAEELRRAGDWHGSENQEEAFKKAGMPNDYYLGGFEGASLFVHATNLEYDFDSDDKAIRLKRIGRPDPSRILVQLGKLTLKMLTLYELIWEDRGRPEYQEPIAFEDEHGAAAALPVLIALQAHATAVLRDPAPPSS